MLPQATTYAALTTGKGRTEKNIHAILQDGAARNYYLVYFQWFVVGLGDISNILDVSRLVLCGM